MLAKFDLRAGLWLTILVVAVALLGPLRARAADTLPVLKARDYRKLPHAVACAAFLTARDQLDPSLRHSPQASLSDIRALLKQSRGVRADAEYEADYGYLTCVYQDSLAKPSQAPATVLSYKPTLAHLRDLETDTVLNKNSVAHVELELRGPEAVARYFAQLNQNVAETNGAVDAELRARYPRLRAGTAVESALLASLPLIQYQLHASPLAEQFGAALFLGVMGSVMEMFSRMPVALHQQRALFAQMRTIRGCLTANCLQTAPVSIVSGAVEVPTAFHRALMKNARAGGGPSVSDLAQESRYSRFTAFDHAVESAQDRLVSSQVRMDELYAMIIDEPEGPTRTLYYDSIFYIDRENGKSEPVWLIYYRAYNEVPPPPPPASRDRSRGWQTSGEGWRERISAPQWAPAPGQ